MADEEIITTRSTPYFSEDLDYIADEAERLYREGGVDTYGKTLLPDMSPERRDAYDMMESIARGGGGVSDAAVSMLSDTLSGQYLSPETNPYLKGMYDDASAALGEAFRRETIPGLAAQFASGGRYGSGMMTEMLGRGQEAVADSMGELANKLYGGAYESERDRMLKGLGYLPEVEKSRYFDADRLADVGSNREMFEREQLADEYDMFMREQLNPYENLSRYLNVVGGDFGGDVSRTEPGLSDFEKFLAYAGEAAGIGADLKDIFRT
ncbi:MAG: hypothetical protein CMC15_16165 [Flavobacteriaceae bacterium]|jgi:hypothetical protein|nr:hypothetical protein [Flavobacteriaceae bacterium]|tara:strand:+ start:264 stop:1064 length:801 start_codon:yes stop_codon:yes gene_type:complete